MATAANYKPDKLPWLKPISVTTQHFDMDYVTGIFDNVLKEDKVHNDKMFKLFESSLPPFFNIKYYNFNLEDYEEIFEKGNGEKFIRNCIGLLHWNQNIYYDYCRYVASVRDYDDDADYGSHLHDDDDDHHHEDDHHDDGHHENQRELFSWETSIDEFIHFAHKPFLGANNTSLSDADLCQRSAEFLLEPCILVQLPWQPCLFHQWLTAALAEILLFEKETLEFRHWPMSSDILPLVTNFLSLIRDLKERIVLGFAILNEQTMLNIDKHVRHERKFVENIMDNVILPSLPTLEFLTSENSKSLLQNVKYLHKTQDNKNSYVPLDCYTLLPSLATFSSEFAYNFPLWLQHKVSDLYNVAPEKIGHIAAQLNEPRSSDVKNDKVKPMSYEEDELRDCILYWDPDECLTFTKDVVCEMIIQTGRLKSVSVADVEQKFTKEEALKCGYNMEKNTDENIYTFVVKQACSYKSACELLVGAEKYESVASQIITLQLEMAKQEQLVRLAQSCALLFNTELLTPPPEDKRVVNVEELTSKIDQVRDEIKKQKRKSFWMKFPKYWRQNVNPNEEIVEPNSIDKLISQMRDRIGRLIVNCNKTYLENNGKFDNYFEEVNIVQYLLPCFVYGYAYSVSKNSRNSVYLKFIKTLLCKQFEEQFVNICKVKSKITPYYIKNITGICFSKLPRLGTQLKHLTLAYVMAMKVAVESMAEVHGAPEYGNHMFFIVLTTLHDSVRVTSDYTNGSYKTIISALSIYNKSMIYVSKFLREMYNTSRTIGFEIPNVDNCTFPKFPMLKEMYLISMVLYDLSWLILMGDKQYSAKVKETCEGSYMEEMKLKLMFTYEEIQKHMLVESSKNVVYNSKKFYFDFEKNKKMIGCMFVFNGITLKFLKKISLSMGEDFDVAKLPHSSQCESVRKTVRAILTKRDLETCINAMPLLTWAGIKIQKERLHICRSCGKQNKKLKACKRCVAQKYPQISYYCSKKCEAKMWKLEHMAEHLEFELDLGEFSSLNVKESEPLQSTSSQ